MTPLDSPVTVYVRAVDTPSATVVHVVPFGRTLDHVVGDRRTTAAGAFQASVTDRTLGVARSPLGPREPSAGSR